MARAVEAPPGSEPIPNRAAFKIGEASRLVGVKAHVLRFWEQEFPQVAPQKGATGHRVYAREDVVRLRQLRALLHDRGYTIIGARALLAEGEAAVEAALAGRPLEAAAAVEDLTSRLAEAQAACAAEAELRRVAEKALTRAREEAAFWRTETRRAEDRLKRLQAAVLAEAERAEAFAQTPPKGP